MATREAQVIDFSQPPNLLNVDRVISTFAEAAKKHTDKLRPDNNKRQRASGSELRASGRELRASGSPQRASGSPQRASGCSGHSAGFLHRASGSGLRVFNSPDCADRPATYEKLSESAYLNIRRSVNFWYKFCSDSFILNVVLTGYKLPFISTPPKQILNNNASALCHKNFVNYEIENLLQKGYIEKLNHPPRVVNPLTVSVNSDGKQRLILDLRAVNLHLFKFCVKYEGLNYLKSYVESEGYLIKFDLKSGYHHIGIFEEHRTFLGFSFMFNGVKSYFHFNVLPFGLSTACSVFTKFLKPLVSKWRDGGIKIILYLDDGIVTNKNLSILERQAKTIKHDLLACGFFVNEEKSQWIPVHSLEWLGMVVNLNNMSFCVPHRKMCRVAKHLAVVQSSLTTTARLLGKLVGQIISLRPATGDVAILRTRYMQIAISESSSWDEVFSITDLVRSEFSFWLKFFEKDFLESPILPPALPRGTLSLYTDASGFGGGGFISEIPNSECNFAWDRADMDTSSTYRELKAFYMCLKLIYPANIFGKSLCWHTDSHNCVNIVKVGSMKTDLQNLALKISVFLEQSRISLSVRWVPRELNVKADFLSKYVDKDDWRVTDQMFLQLDSLWGPHTFDRFANSENSRCLRFNSKFNCPGSSGVDSLQFDWRSENNWLVPPVDLICESVLHLQANKAFGTLIVPKWKAASFWPLIFNGKNFNAFVKEVVEFKKPANFFCSKTNTMFDRKLQFDVLALKINCSL